MGWLIGYRGDAPRNYAEEKAKVIGLHTASADAPVKYEVLQACKVGVFWVCACKVIPLTPERAAQMHGDSRYVADADGSYTFASVIKTCHSEGGWGYKDGDESTGFYGDFSKVPASLIAKLSPLKADQGGDYDGTACARKWRAMILECKRAPKVKDGMRIRLATPALFTSGHAFPVWCNDFTVTTYQRRGQARRAYRANDIGGTLVRLSESFVRGFEVIA